MAMFRFLVNSRFSASLTSTQAPPARRRISALRLCSCYVLEGSCRRSHIPVRQPGPSRPDASRLAADCCTLLPSADRCQTPAVVACYLPVPPLLSHCFPAALIRVNHVRFSSLPEFRRISAAAAALFRLLRRPGPHRVGRGKSQIIARSGGSPC